jgi:hypothetical protein
MSATTSKATLFRICSFLTLFFCFLTAFVGEMVILLLHPEAAQTILYIACIAIIVGCIACLKACVPPTWPFSAASAASSSATATPVCYYVFIIIICIAYLVLTAALLLYTYDAQHENRLVMLLLLVSPLAYLAGCAFVGVGALKQCRKLGRSVQDVGRLLIRWWRQTTIRIAFYLQVLLCYVGSAEQFGAVENLLRVRETGRVLLYLTRLGNLHPCANKICLSR